MYGRILYNNIKEYTPKWFPTIPYSQTVKPTFSNFLLIEARGPQMVSAFNAAPATKKTWRFFAATVQANSWAYQILIFGIAFFLFHSFYDPFLYFYIANNKHRTYEAAMVKERAHKKKLKDLEAAEAES